MNIVEGKTKRIVPMGTVDGKEVVAFEQLGRSVNADGTTVTESEKNVSDTLISSLVSQNHNMFSLLNNLGVPTTYLGRGEQTPLILLHERCEPLALEFVVRFAVCNASSIIYREPERYGKKLYDGTFSSTEADPKFFNEKGQVILFKKPVVETFHKKCLIEKPDGSIDLIFESEAKKDPRYFKDGKMTPFMHEDPLLFTDGSDWLVFDQKKPLSQQGYLAVIDRENQILMDKNYRPMRELEDYECISPGVEHILQTRTVKTLSSIQAACKNTSFKKAEFVDGKIVFDGVMETPVIIDGKLEYGKLANKTFSLTDDLVSDNMRWAFGGYPQISLKRLFQNYESLEQKLLVAAMVAEGTKNWPTVEFAKNMVPIY